MRAIQIDLCSQFTRNVSEKEVGKNDSVSEKSQLFNCKVIWHMNGHDVLKKQNILFILPENKSLGQPVLQALLVMCCHTATVWPHLPQKLCR